MRNTAFNHESVKRDTDAREVAPEHSGELTNRFHSALQRGKVKALGIRRSVKRVSRRDLSQSPVPGEPHDLYFAEWAGLIRIPDDDKNEDNCGNFQPRHRRPDPWPFSGD